VNPLVRFEDEADAEYRQAGRWYENRRTGLGIEFFNAVDAAIRQIGGDEVPWIARVIPILAIRDSPMTDRDDMLV
jgi:hypothetical protein